MAFTQLQAYWGNASDSYQADANSNFFMYQKGLRKLYIGSGDPNGVITGAIGDMAYDITLGTEYRCMAAGTVWQQITPAPTLSSTPTACGIEIQVGAKQYISAYHAGATIGKVYVFDHTQTSGQELTAIAPATETTPRRSGVALAVTAGITWYQIGGIASAFWDGTDNIAAGDHLEVINTGQDWIKDAAAIDVTSGAVALAAYETDAAALGSSNVFLINKTHTVAAA